jgi:hypothetical protein
MAVFLLGVLADELKGSAGAKITTGNEAPQMLQYSLQIPHLLVPYGGRWPLKKLQVFIEKHYTKKSD